MDIEIEGFPAMETKIFPVKRHSRVRLFRVLFLVIIILLPAIFVLAWLSLPFYLTDYANERLARFPGYNAHVMSVTFDLRKPTVSVDGFYLSKKEETAPAAFMAITRITVSVPWVDLLSRRWRFDIVLEQPQTMFLMRQRQPGQPRKFGVWQKFFEDKPGFLIRGLKIRNGSLRIRNNEDIPPTDIFFDRINASAFNMSNRQKLLSPGPSRVEGKGRMMNHAPLWLAIDAEPFQPHAVFHLSGRLENFQLTTLNYILNHYTGVDLKQGTLRVEGNLMAGDGSFGGPVTRRIADAEILRQRRDHLGFIQKAKEFLFSVWVNHKMGKDNVAENTYQLSGPLGYMDQDVFLACVWVAKSAFLQSFRPDLKDAVVMGPPEQAEEEWVALQSREREKQKAK